MAIRVVCFDVGGVLARIVKTWAEAAQHAGVQTESPNANQYFAKFSGLDPYQGDDIDLDEYLRRLADHLDLATKEQALAVHNAILVEEYPGVLDLVHQLQANQIKTACLSNTNAPHFEIMKTSGRFPAIAGLDLQMASHEVGCNKPDEAIFRVFEDKAHAAGQEIVFFDDGLKNVEAASLIGWHTTQIDPDNDPARQMRERLTQLGVLASEKTPPVGTI